MYSGASGKSTTTIIPKIALALPLNYEPGENNLCFEKQAI